MKKNIIIITLFFILPQIQIYTQPNNKVESITVFTTEIKRSLSIDEDITFMDLGSLTPGDTMYYNSTNNSIVFTVKGQQYEDILLNAEIFDETDSVKIEDLVWEYWDGNQWHDLRLNATTSGEYSFSNFIYKLDEFGYATLRVYPKKITTHPNISPGKFVNFSVKLMCEYYKW